MTITRTRVSGDYIKPSNSCSAEFTSGTTTTRTRVSGDYIKPSGTIYCGRTVHTSPSWYNRPYFFSNATSVYTSTPVYTSPTISDRSVTSCAENIAGVLLITTLLIGGIALIAMAPRCHLEEVCKDILGTTLESCHLERVCVY